MPFQAGASFLRVIRRKFMGIPTVVSMPFRASASFLQTSHRFYQCRKTGYQCPFGLKLHFYLLKIFPLLPLLFLYQCPFGLGLHFYRFFHYGSFKNWSVSMPFRASTPFLHVSAISPDKYPLRYQCPLGLKLHFYIKPAETDSSLEYGINALSG